MTPTDQKTVRLPGRPAPAWAVGMFLAFFVVGAAVRNLGVSPSPAAATAHRDALAGHESQAWAVAKELIRLREGEPGMRLPGYNWQGRVTYRARGRYACEVPHGGGHFTVRLVLSGPPDDLASWAVVSYKRPARTGS